MNRATEVRTVWNQLAEAMCLKTSSTAEVKSSELASFSFGRFQSSGGLPEIASRSEERKGLTVAAGWQGGRISSRSLARRREEFSCPATSGRQGWARLAKAHSQFVSIRDEISETRETARSHNCCKCGHAILKAVIKTHVLMLIGYK
jgi:hypothetical protein